MRVQRLLEDLAGNDLPMALLDLSQLHRLVAGARPDHMAEALAAMAPAVFGLEAQEEDQADENDDLDASALREGLFR